MRNPTALLMEVLIQFLYSCVYREAGFRTREWCPPITYKKVNQRPRHPQFKLAQSSLESASNSGQLDYTFKSDLYNNHLVSVCNSRPVLNYSSPLAWVCAVSIEWVSVVPQRTFLN